MTSTQRKRIGEAVERMNSLSLRTLAAAQSEDCRGGEEGMTFLGIVGMRDPARPEAGEAVEIFRHAGVTTVMITGDHVDTDSWGSRDTAASVLRAENWNGWMTLLF